MANSKGKNTVSVVEELAVPIAADLGLRIWDVRYLKEGSQWFLRVFIDKDGGVDINDCENMSRALDAPLDELDPIAGEYIDCHCEAPQGAVAIPTDYNSHYGGARQRLRLPRRNDVPPRNDNLKCALWQSQPNKDL